ELAGTALAMEQQRFLVGKCRSCAAAIAFRRHLNPLYTPWRMAGGPKVADRMPIAQGKPLASVGRPACAPHAGRGSASPPAARPTPMNQTGRPGNRWGGGGGFSTARNEMSGLLFG